MTHNTHNTATEATSRRRVTFRTLVDSDVGEPIMVEIDARSFASIHDACPSKGWPVLVIFTDRRIRTRRFRTVRDAIKGVRSVARNFINL
jgi:hypothetical protein